VAPAPVGDCTGFSLQARRCSPPLACGAVEVAACGL